jgi:hypothetical protein
MVDPQTPDHKQKWATLLFVKLVYILDFHPPSQRHQPWGSHGSPQHKDHCTKAFPPPKAVCLPETQSQAARLQGTWLCFLRRYQKLGKYWSLCLNEGLTKFMYSFWISSFPINIEIMIKDRTWIGGQGKKRVGQPSILPNARFLMMCSQTFSAPGTHSIFFITFFYSNSRPKEIRKSCF